MTLALHQSVTLTKDGRPLPPAVVTKVVDERVYFTFAARDVVSGYPLTFSLRIRGRKLIDSDGREVEIVEETGSR